MNIYLKNSWDRSNYGFPQGYDFYTIKNLFEDLEYEFFDIDNSELKENSLFILESIIFLDKNISKKEDIISIKNKKIVLYFNHRCLFDSPEIKSYLQSIKNRLNELNFKDENVYYIAQLKSDIDIVKKELGQNVNVWYKDRWLNELKLFFISKFENKIYELPKKQKFSVFVRRLDAIHNLRLHLFCELITKNLIENFHYTFCGEIKEPEMMSMVDKGKEICKDYVYKLPDTYNKSEILNWVDNIPYSSNELSAGYDDFFSTSLVPFYQNSDINLVVESHLLSRIGKGDWSLITEKTYKAIFHKKPFLLLSYPNTLKILTDCGYKTFDGIIDESYDKIEDVYERIRKIVDEIERLNSLPADKFQELLDKCQHIVEYNYNVLMEEIDKPTPNEFLIKNMTFI